jgi:hypothetical protein
MKHIDIKINKLSGPRPKKRERGSRPDEQLLAIRTLSPNVVCQLTGDSPRGFLFIHGTTYALQQNHKIPYKLLQKWDLNGIEILSPNGHQHITNIQNNKLVITPEEAEVCQFCGLNTFTYYTRTKLVVTLQTHHIDGNRKNNSSTNKIRYCPNCHYATDSHSVNKNKEPFRNKWTQFLQYLHERRSIGFMERKLNTSKGHLQWNFYKTGLDLSFGRSIIEPPDNILHLFENDKASDFFTL